MTVIYCVHCVREKMSEFHCILIYIRVEWSLLFILIMDENEMKATKNLITVQKKKWISRDDEKVVFFWHLLKFSIFFPNYKYSCNISYRLKFYSNMYNSNAYCSKLTILLPLSCFSIQEKFVLLDKTTINWYWKYCRISVLS